MSRTGPSPRPVLPAVLVALGCLAAVAGGVAALSAVPAGERPVRFWANDGFCPPGRLARVTAHVVLAEPRPRVNPGVGGRTVLLFREGRFVQQARTDGDGVAVFTVRAPRETGPCFFEAELRTPALRARTPLVLHVHPETMITAVLNLEGLLVEGGGAALAAEPPGAVRAAPGAVEAVRRLAARYVLIYLSAEDQVLTPRVRAFLARSGFPPGVLVLRDDTLSHVAVDEFRVLRIKEMRVFTNGAWMGVGRGTGDARVFQRANIPGVVVTGDTIDVLPRRVRSAATLAEAVDLVLGRR